ncbi:hypothetical protein ANME2D_01430 [Candidatus Methanoperedens nitroreducens]|uniref:DUF4194 domain-containing protein n=1 Tax=Candidatus Methanoperedens nitratireducens TaxID=1392998 RepID=A0A062V9K2_9EURY|nr:DUF4194 domain-containing protein [Candidatus Methanoperedens nitroreducens]KCZ72030.1 hypothetical protein ANME2D_01430 [Candidatus Methanoperedens nitroreducens]MDJ1421995.1 DUF4194 domain-containing protein [Candidatus Methanoperedens sp.]
MTENNMIPPYAPVIIKLLQGVIYNDDKEPWDNLVSYQVQIKEYFELIGIDVHIYESEGFAFLKQKQFDEGQEINLPNLIEKRQLSYPVTLLCVLLVEKLVEFDVTGGDSTRLIVDKEELKEMLRIFLPERTNEAKLFDNIDAHINKLVDYGFLRKLNNAESKYEVKRILKAKIPADTLQEIKNRLEEYAKSIA